MQLIIRYLMGMRIWKIFVKHKTLNYLQYYIRNYKIKDSVRSDCEKLVELIN